MSLMWEVRWVVFFFFPFNSCHPIFVPDKRFAGCGLLKIHGGDALQQPFYFFTSKGNVVDPIQTRLEEDFEGITFGLRQGLMKS